MIGTTIGIIIIGIIIIGMIIGINIGILCKNYNRHMIGV